MNHQRQIILSCLLSATALANTISVNAQESLRVWYDAPAVSWMREALPAGNGYVGVMVFGSPEEEHIQFSEGSLWAGGPGSGNSYNFGLSVNASGALDSVRKLLEQGLTAQAEDHMRQYLTGKINSRPDLSFGDYGAQQPMGDLYVETGHNAEPGTYTRELTLADGRIRIRYRDGLTTHRRTIFGCYPARAMVYRFENDRPGGCKYRIRLSFPHPIDSLMFRDQTLIHYGHVNDNGLEFLSLLTAETDGIITYHDGVAEVANATFLVLKHTAHTAYKNQYPEYRNPEWEPEALAGMESLKMADYAKLERIQKEDYQHLFSRVSLNIQGPTYDTIPTGRRLEAQSRGHNDPQLVVLMFQYARYLMISASRKGALPMHLQGKWNNSTDPPWACDYHTNINLQMLYWPADVTNLPECHLPLFDYLQQLVIPGSITSAHFYGCRGWVVHTMNNAFGYTAPGWDLPWGHFPAGAAWLTRHMYEYFEFTGDTAFLKQTALPLMKEAALFWMDYLKPGPGGFLVSSPSWSPEHGGISRGASMDHQIVRDLFNNILKACRAPGADEIETEPFRKIRDSIAPLRTGRWGQLQEWLEDTDDPENRHRHVSHLFALYPGSEIGVKSTPQLAEAALTSLRARGNDGTGWSLAWKINLYARLQQADTAHILIRKMMTPVKEESVQMDNGGTYSNLLCAHPPFQLDGNMGLAAGIAEMLMQSHEGLIRLLPALPAAWPSGSVSGLKARGNLTVDMQWQDGRVEEFTIHGNPLQSVRVSSEDAELLFQLPPDGSIKHTFTTETSIKN
ncbi:MAG TPA: glycoside hydrolase family 95 protein [Lentimicrobium sp.]|nr:glycoside hydrolase family 95 protein [Lentimicrobium sp.]